MAQYKAAAFGELSPLSHPFAFADVAYSGESEAGETESTKLLMQYLAYLGGRAASEGRTVEQQVLESNPVLEAFSNANTVRNNSCLHCNNANCFCAALWSFVLVYLFQYLAYLGGRAESEGRTVEQQVLEVSLAFQPVQQS
ncbi:unnamed protein product [Ilex paraguariensis]|uniref:Myosin motor domain-containing protein n=1 Tax=Ilex paraguariensis TaxID=185542 RepID=A0ABC8QXH3_9AQUA